MTADIYIQEFLDFAKEANNDILKFNYQLIKIRNSLQIGPYGVFKITKPEYNFEVEIGTYNDVKVKDKRFNLKKIQKLYKKYQPELISFAVVNDYYIEFKKGEFLLIPYDEV